MLTFKDRTVATKTQRHLRSVVKLILSQTGEKNSHPVSQLIGLLSEPLNRFVSVLFFKTPSIFIKYLAK